MAGPHGAQSAGSAATSWADLIEYVAECEAIQEDLAERLGRREITTNAFAKANAPLSASLTELSAERETLSGGSPEGPTEALTADEIAAQWDGAEIPQRRAMLKQAMGDSVIRVARAAPGAPRRFDPERISPE